MGSLRRRFWVVQGRPVTGAPRTASPSLAAELAPVLAPLADTERAAEQIRAAATVAAAERVRAAHAEAATTPRSAS